jgi:hypothetical protein
MCVDGEAYTPATKRGDRGFASPSPLQKAKNGYRGPGSESWVFASLRPVW